MPQTTSPVIEGLPASVATLLSQFVAAAKETYGTELVSVVLYGSGAEGKLAPTSDVNVLVVLQSFARDKGDRLQNTFLAAEAAIRLRAMFLLREEIPAAVELFAQKFADIFRRNKVLYGSDPFAGITISRKDQIFRLRQILLNLTLRLREAYVARSQNDAEVLRIMANVFGPLRAAAATLLALEGKPTSDSTAALQSLAASVDQGPVVQQIFAAHRGETPSGKPQESLAHLLDLLKQMAQRADGLVGGQP